jgi:hypothetical protein
MNGLIHQSAIVDCQHTEDYSEASLLLTGDETLL